MVTTNQKPTVDTHKLERRENKHTTNEDHQSTREEIVRRRKHRRTGKHLINWQYMPIANYFKCQWTKCTIKKHRVTDRIKREKQDSSVCYLRGTHFRAKTHTE